MSTKPVAIVTGAARGIGKGCAIELAKAGFNLLLNDKSDEESIEKLKITVDLVKEAGSQSVCFHADISDLSTHQPMIDSALKQWGRVDCLINNAGVSVLSRGDLLDVTEESFDNCINVNTRGLFFLSQAFSRQLAKVEPPKDCHRSIINITSINAMMLAMNRGEYCVSKSASSMATKLFALRMIDHKVGVYEIRPGLIETEMTIPSKDRYASYIDDGVVPERRWGFPADIASTARAMAEGKLRYTCGEFVTIDGGLGVPRF